MSDTIDISVIVPTYKRDNDLKRALYTLVNQTNSNFEIIVVDDNDDEVWNNRVSSVIEDFMEQNKEMRLIYFQNHPNQGSARSRNLGIEAANGRYITFLDDDDEYLPEKLESQYRFMAESQLDYSITDLDLYFENDKLSEHRTREYIENTDRQSLLKYHFMYHMTGTDTLMFSREYLKKIGGFSPIDVGDEFYLMQRAIEGNGRFGYLDRCDVKAYVHTGEGSLSSGEGKIRGENQLFAHKKQYFSHLDKKSIRYIKMRHYVVLAFAYLRMRRYGVGFMNGVQGLAVAPIQCVKMILNIR